MNNMVKGAAKHLSWLKSKFIPKSRVTGSSALNKVSWKKSQSRTMCRYDRLTIILQNWIVNDKSAPYLVKYWSQDMFSNDMELFKH